MALPSLAPLSALVARLPNGVPESQEARAQAALDDASALVREESRQTWVNEDDEITAPDALVRIALHVAKRDFLNPDGLAIETETAGPFTRTKTRDRDESGSYLTEEEAEICQRYRVQAQPLWTRETTRGEDTDDTLWLDTENGTPFPVGYSATQWWL